ncbi:hypothetical protein J3A83DRAFT_4087325 [Scleroderma citrinum]
MDITIAGFITSFAIWQVLLALFRRSRSLREHLLGSIWLGYRPLVHTDDDTTSSLKLSFITEEFVQRKVSQRSIPPEIPPISLQRCKDITLPPISTNNYLSRRRGPEAAPIFFLLNNVISSGLSRRVNGRLSVAQVFVMIAYSAGILVALNFRCQIFSYSPRSGWIIVSQIPFLYAFGTKNNLAGYLTGSGYEKLHYLHRLVGRWMFIAAQLHAFNHIYKWSLANTWSENVSLNFVRWGLVTYTTLSLQWLLSTRPIRHVAYRFFYVTHIVGSVTFLFAVSKHAPISRPYVLTAVVVYGLDHFIRLLKTRVTTANIRVVPELGLTCVEIPTINKGWCAGQHVRLRVLSTGEGLWDALEAHPFTISTVPGNKQGLVIACKDVGRWTSKLFNMANSSTRGERGLTDVKTVRVMVEGPYGGTGYSVISKHSAVILIVGGSGVTFALSTTLEILQRRGSCSVRVMHIVWCVPTPAHFSSLIPFFRFLVAKRTITNMRVKVRIFCTRASTTPSDWLDAPRGITITPGRPQMGMVVDRFILASRKSRGEKNGLFIGVCGPGALGKDVAEVVRTLDVNCKNAVGGIHLHEE